MVRKIISAIISSRYLIKNNRDVNISKTEAKKTLSKH